MENDPDTHVAGDEPAKPTEEGDKSRGNLFALEICFLGFIALVVIWAFLEATTYALVSSRTPFVIMAPLLVLIAIHGLRLWRVRVNFTPTARISEALSGKTVGFNKALGISGWMVAMTLMILVFGHYAGVFAFCVILMRFLAGEKWVLTVLTAAGTTFFIWGVFEYLFEINLYRGLIIRYFLGFRDFG